MSSIYGFFGGSHSPATSLIVDGEIVCCVEEERITRIKAGDNFDAVAALSSKAVEEFTNLKILDADHRVFVEPVTDRFANQITNHNYDRVSHHDAHCYGSYFTSGMEGKVLTISYDGGGDKSVMKVYMCEDGEMSLLYNYDMCDTGSLAHLWGFSTNGIMGYNQFFEGNWKICKDEGKLMGMAPNGHYDEKIYKILNSCIDYENLKFFPSNTQGKTQVVIDSMFRKGYFQTKTQREIFSYNLQKLTEDLFISFLNDLHKRFPNYKKLCFAGGLFANVKLNQKINELDWVDEIYIYPAMGDEGLSLGACIYKAVQLGEWTKPKKLKNLYFGLKYSDDEVLSISKKFNFNITKYEPNLIAVDLNDDKIIGWFQDGFEYGPRALGARSILVRPTDIGTHEILNSRLKRYELMPFAPIVMDEYFDEIFTGNKSKYSAEFMTICYSTKESWIEKIPAVIQKSDKTARPQLVKKDNSPKFWEILNEYNKLSGIPVLLNTSFNSHNQPIIDNPEDAFYALESNIIDKLVIGNYVYTNK
jgi:carbamoyltransferase